MPNLSLLPANATPLEKALEQLNSVLAVFPFDSLNQFNPLTTHASLLPYLAWQNRVFNWSDTQSGLRKLITSAPDMNRKRGTETSLRFAIERIIPVASYTITPWFQLSAGQPFTFAVQIAPSYPLDINLYQKLTFYIDQMKSQRDQYAIEATLQMNMPLYRGGTAASFSCFYLGDLADDDTFKWPRLTAGVAQTLRVSYMNASKQSDALSDGLYGAGTTAFYQSVSISFQ